MIPARALAVLLAACILRLWLMPLSSSLWVDELVTTFVLRFPHHYSFAVAPQVPDSLYYWLPRISWSVLGHSETALRLPSILAMGAALFFIARIAARIVHPRAAWLAVFLCLSLSGIDYFAADARPYAFGIAVASASILFLIRWFDRGRWGDQLVFLLCAALLWRIHLLYWPFYLIYPAYAIARLQQRDSSATLSQILAALIVLPLAFAPVAVTALGRLAGATAHAFNPPPGIMDFVYKTHFNVVLICGGVAWILHALARWKPSATSVSGASWVLVILWWLACPLCIAAYSYATGNGVFIPRYVSLMLPGIALAATAVSARFLPDHAWKPAAAAAGAVGLALMGQWFIPHTRHDADDWRAASALERALADDRTPVLCASPFIEAQAPVWSPDYALPGFLYSHLAYYPVRGNLKLFPFVQSPEASQYADRLLASDLLPARRFVVYGPAGGSGYLLKYFGHRPELAGWHMETRKFGNVSVATIDAPATLSGR